MEWGWVAVLIVSALCGYVGGSVRSLVLHRGQLGLSYRIQDLEQRNLTTQNREKSKRRWEKEETQAEEEQAFLSTIKGRTVEPAGVRYANDPLPDYNGNR